MEYIGILFIIIGIILIVIGLLVPNAQSPEYEAKENDDILGNLDLKEEKQTPNNNFSYSTRGIMFETEEEDLKKIFSKTDDIKEFFKNFKRIGEGEITLNDKGIMFQNHEKLSFIPYSDIKGISFGDRYIILELINKISKIIFTEDANSIKEQYSRLYNPEYH